MTYNITDILIQKTDLTSEVVRNIIGLIEEGNTIPFIARYRKEATEGASDTQLRDFEEVYSYQIKLLEKKADIIRLLEEKEVITDELRDAVQAALTLAALDDIYRPFKDKKNTRATKAIARGLQPLADLLLVCGMSKDKFVAHAANFIVVSDDEKLAVATAEEAIQGAKDIVAEIVADSPDVRGAIKEEQESVVPLLAKATKHFEENSVYDTYKDYSRPLATMPSYAYLAVSRAEREKQLRVKVIFDEGRSLGVACDRFLPRQASDLQSILSEAIEDGIKRLLHPSLERELRSAKKEQADHDAIEIFGKNVEELLLSSPVKGKTIIGFDPAYRTGCKLAVIDHTGKYLTSVVIYPTKPQEDVKKSAMILLNLIQKYDVGLICIGNGTGSRESEEFVAGLIKHHELETKYLVVNEAGASVYSASELAHEEYPSLDVTIRGAINIAQRVQDPLSTYVKIDPKSLGVGQYQHDVDQKLLKEKLENHIEDAVNRVGVDINTASWALLQHIAGLTAKTAKNLVAQREELGAFRKRSQLKKVKGLGAKAFEQCAGFLRIDAASEPLDRTGIHPESYAVTYDILEKECGIKKKQLTLPYKFPVNKNLSSLAEQYAIGYATLEDIIRELANPGLDPREEFDEMGFKSDILTLKDLVKGMKLQGIVRNITDFGAFVDIGLKNDGLIHKSQLGDGYVRNVFDVLSIGQQLTVTVLDIDLERSRVGLGAKVALPQQDRTTPLPPSTHTQATQYNKKNSEQVTSSLGSRISFS